MKKSIIASIISFIAGFSICVGASVLYNSKDISYTTSYNKNITNVEEALDDLYKNNDTTYTNFIMANGASIEKDSNNDYYINFDGVDDYALLGTIPASVNWSDGFTVSFKAEWDAFNNWSRIFDFGNGSCANNIVVTNYQTYDRLYLHLVNGSTELTHAPAASGSIISNAAHLYKIECIKSDSNYIVNYYMDGELKDSKTISFTINNVERTSNYLGRSNWSADSYFKGRIYYLKVNQADGTNIINIDANKQR